MRWLGQHVWWLAVLGAATGVQFALTSLLDPVPWLAPSVAGQESEILAATSPAAYRLVKVYVQWVGLEVLLINALSLAIVVFAFRRKQRWSWWAMWSSPVFILAQAALHLTSVAPGQTPDGAVYTGTFVALVCAAALLLSAPVFFERRTPQLA
jgi:hypothetical protein